MPLELTGSGLTIANLESAAKGRPQLELSPVGVERMTAARAIGLDVGAMSGFSNAVIDEEFFKGTTLKSNFLCNIGVADESALFQRLPRFEFDEVCDFA